MKCSDMEEGQIYVCPTCGLEIKVINECDGCEDCETGCMMCCGVPLELKGDE